MKPFHKRLTISIIISLFFTLGILLQDHSSVFHARAQWDESNQCVRQAMWAPWLADQQANGEPCWSPKRLRELYAPSHAKAIIRHSKENTGAFGRRVGSLVLPED